MAYDNTHAAALVLNREITATRNFFGRARALLSSLKAWIVTGIKLGTETDETAKMPLDNMLRDIDYPEMTAVR